ALMPPNWRSCPFCGRQYGNSSLGIHVERCTMRPDEETLRKQLAAANKARGLAPSGGKGRLAGFSGDGGTPLGYAPCAICGRTFAPDRVAKHQAICSKIEQKRRR
ncbi:hypothetical protein T492DRAFT_581545, partial [Pavlovales sp. CCMP2436]